MLRHKILFSNLVNFELNSRALATGVCGRLCPVSDVFQSWHCVHKAELDFLSGCLSAEQRDRVLASLNRLSRECVRTVFPSVYLSVCPDVS